MDHLGLCLELSMHYGNISKYFLESITMFMLVLNAQ